jgi:cell division protein FtsB
MTTRILPNALHFSEFQGGYHGTCGETALATAMVCATPQIEDTQQAINLMLSMTQELIGLGWASSSGSTTTQHLHDEAIRRGFVPDGSFYISFAQPLPNSTTFHNLLLATAGVKPIVVEIANAGVLEGNNVQYHFICIVGITDTGYICNDGDNPTIASHLVTYSWSQIEAAVPCGVLVLNMQGGSAMTVPAGWKDANGVLTAPNGVPVIHGMRDFVLANNWYAGDVPLGPEQSVPEVELGNPSIGAGVVQFFEQSGQLGWSASFNNGQVYRVWQGQEEVALHKALDAANSRASALQAEVTSLDQQVAALQQQVQALKNQPASAPLDPSVKNALSAAAQLLQPYSTALDDVQAALKTLP